MNKTLIITTSSFGKANRKPLDLLESNGIKVTLNPHGRKLEIDESLELMNGFEAIIAGTEALNETVLGSAKGLKFLCRLGAGMDNVDMKATEKFGIKVDNTPNSHVNAVAELTMGGILDLMRGISFADRQIRKNSWEKPMGNLLRGKTIGIIGFGRVGRALAKLLAPFEMPFLIYDPYIQQSDLADFANSTSATLTDIATNSDIISLHLPLSDSKYLIEKEFLSKVKSNVKILNCSRGGIINEEDLLNFLNDNPKSSAFLDVFENEPYSGPLNKLENVVLTSHIGSYAEEIRLEMEMEAAQKVINYFNHGQ